VFKSVYEHLRNELVMTMRLAGTPTIKSIVPGCVERVEVQGTRLVRAAQTAKNAHQVRNGVDLAQRRHVAMLFFLSSRISASPDKAAQLSDAS
jgi:hypothetical protein